MIEDRKDEFIMRCIADELSQNTVEKYEVNIRQFIEYMQDKEPTKDVIIDYKAYLMSDKVNNGNGYKTSTVNNKLISINKYLDYLQLDELKVNILKEQGRTLEDGMTLNDFERLRRIAVRKNRTQDVLILDIFINTGIRVSEMKFFTLEAVKKGYMEISNKGKIRRVPITKKLAKLSKEYAKEQGIEAGSLIINSKGSPLHRDTIFSHLKWLSGQARVKKSKVSAHAIRHLFAKEWLKKNNNNILALADILGHESLETTRIYTKMNLDELRETMN